MKSKDITLFPYRSVLRWIKDQNPTQDKPICIPKYGGRSKVPFRVWPFAGCLLLMSGEKANHEAQYILTPEKWRSFVDYLKKNRRWERWSWLSISKISVARIKCSGRR